jgi:hypothetical protein
VSIRTWSSTSFLIHLLLYVPRYNGQFTVSLSCPCTRLSVLY